MISFIVRDASSNYQGLSHCIPEFFSGTKMIEMRESIYLIIIECFVQSFIFTILVLLKSSVSIAVVTKLRREINFQ